MSRDSEHQLYLVEILLPIFGKSGQEIPKVTFDCVHQELIDKFGGVTTFIRSPAIGQWQDGNGHVRRDDIATVEVMSEALDTEWWHRYRQKLEVEFDQEVIVIRSSVIQAL